MKSSSLWLTAVILLLSANCSHLRSGNGTESPPGPFTGEVEILQNWRGDYPVNQLDRLPKPQRNRSVGYITDAQAFASIWTAFKPGEPVPRIDFNSKLVLYVRNTQYFNRVSIAKVSVEEGVAELLTMETLSAIPIEDKVAISMVAISRRGIEAVQTGKGAIPVE